jgi:hypothetical protein
MAMNRRKFLFSSAAGLMLPAAFGQVYLPHRRKAWRGSGAPASTSWITSSPATGTRNDQSLALGCLFAVGGASITVTHLGRWVVSGNSATHRVAITSISPNPPTVLADATIVTSGATAGAFAYAALGTPVVLSASTSYRIYSNETSGADYFYSIGTFTVTGVATVTNGCFSTNQSTFNDPSESTAGKIFVPCNFKYY